MTDSDKKPRPAAADETPLRTQHGLTTFVDLVTPWLLELGSWIFGALIAFNVVILGVVLTIGPVDSAVTIAIAGFAFALPPNIAGFVLLRLVDDMRKIRLQEAAATAPQAPGLSLEDMPSTDRQKLERKLGSITLRYTYGLMAVTVLLTLTGLTAALWHGALWIGIGFLVMLAVSQGVMVLAASQLGGGGNRWRAQSSADAAKTGEKPAPE